MHNAENGEESDPNDEPRDDVQAPEFVDFSRFALSFTPLTSYYTGMLDTLKRMSDIATPTVKIPPIKYDLTTSMAPPGGIMGSSLAELTGIKSTIDRLFEPLTRYQETWQNIFRSATKLKLSIYPANMRDANPTFDELEHLLIDEGVPLMWVPSPQVVQALLDAPSASARRRLLGRRWKRVVTDCEMVIRGVDHPNVRDSRHFALACVQALREGHSSPAQALTANLLDTLMRQHFDDASRVRLTKNDFKKKGVRFNFDDYRIRVAFTFAPVWYAYAKYRVEDGDTIPRAFGRHPSAHGVSRLQYSRINAVIGLMLVASVLKFFDLELER